MLQPLACLCTKGLVDSVKVASLACLDCSSGIKEQVIVPKVHACSHCCSLHAIAEVVITCSSAQPLSQNLIWSNVRQHPRGLLQSKTTHRNCNLLTKLLMAAFTYGGGCQASVCIPSTAHVVVRRLTLPASSAERAGFDQVLCLSSAIMVCSCLQQQHHKVDLQLTGND